MPGWGPGHSQSPWLYVAALGPVSPQSQMGPVEPGVPGHLLGWHHSPDSGNGGGGSTREAPQTCAFPRKAPLASSLRARDALGRTWIQFLAPIPDTPTTALGELGQVSGRVESSWGLVSGPHPWAGQLLGTGKWGPSWAQEAAPTLAGQLDSFLW